MVKDASGKMVGNKELLPYACLGVACAGLLYLVVAALVKIVGVNKVMKLFPSVSVLHRLLLQTAKQTGGSPSLLSVL